MMIGSLVDEVMGLVQVEIPKITPLLPPQNAWGEAYWMTDFRYMETSSQFAFSDLFRFRSVDQVRLIAEFGIPT